MHFLVPWMLFGALTAGIPVALHLLRKSKPTVVRWAAMEFLRKSLKETSKKIRLRDLILLLIRMTILILAALALARPSSSTLFGSGPIDAILLIDNSQSMSTVEGQSTRLEMAINSAKQLLSNLPKGSKARIISLTDQSVELAYNNINETDALLAAFLQIKQTDRSSDFYQGFVNAIDILKSSSFSQRKIFFFSDMQKSGWQKEAGSFISLTQNLPNSISLHMIRQGSDVDSNIQLVDFQPASGIVLANQRQTWTMTFRNRGFKPVLGIKATLGAGGDFESAESTTIEKLEAGDERQATVDLLLPIEGYQNIKAIVGNDRFVKDNQKEKLVQARKKLQVLIVGAKSEIDPNRNNGFFLYHALRSGASDSSNSGIEVKQASGKSASLDYLDDSDVVFMVDPNLSGPESIPEGFIEKLESWVSKGNPLVYFAGSNYAKTMETDPKLAGKFLPPCNPEINNISSTIATENLPQGGWFSRFRTAPLNLISQSEFRKRVVFDSTRLQQSALLGYFLDGQPLLEMRMIRSGFLTLLPWVPDLTYTDLPLRPSFVPFVQTLLSRIIETSNDSKNPSISKELSLRLQSKDIIEGEKYKWVSPSNINFPATMEKSVDEILFRGAFTVPESGIWKLEPLNPASTKINFNTSLVAVQSSNEEGEELNPLQSNEIDEILGKPVFHQENTGELSSGVNPGEITNFLLYLLFGFFAFEMFFAWWCGQPL